jgi:hypothetical protein
MKRFDNLAAAQTLSLVASKNARRRLKGSPHVDH